MTKVVTAKPSKNALKRKQIAEMTAGNTSPSKLVTARSRTARNIKIAKVIPVLSPKSEKRLAQTESTTPATKHSIGEKRIANILQTSIGSKVANSGYKRHYLDSTS